MIFALLSTISLILGIVWWVFLIMIIMSWLISFNVINTRNQFVAGVWRVLNRVFSHYEPYKGAIDAGRKGVLVSNSDGETAAYALWNLEERGPIMIDAGVDIYEGMIIGEHARENDLEVNALKGKQLTNIRTTSKDEAVRLTPPKKLTLEQSLGYIADDEYVEVTPKSIRLRKIWLDPNDRKRMMRASVKAG